MPWTKKSGTPLECREIGYGGCSFPSGDEILKSQAGIGSVWLCPTCGMGWRLMDAERRFERVGRDS